ncbi:MAG TPA: phage protein Gp36 family protein [Methylomirabilota bacterium]|jgi:phage gp36-like protein|nr:phage protein Gp36 family protein [Methylomirabilota bacterium]
MPTTSPVSYTSVGLMYISCPDLGSVTTLTSGHLATFAGQAEAEINGNIARLYALPMAGDVPLLTTLATDIAIYKVLTRRLFTSERLAASPWPDRYRESVAMLLKIADGSLPLVTASGAVLAGRSDISEVFSTTKNYVPTIWEGAWPNQDVDPNKIEDEGARRGSEFRDRLI